MGDILLLVLASVLIVFGLLGCILPVIPGPPLSFLGLLTIHYTKFGEEVSSNTLIWMLVLALIVTVLDYLVPIWGTKKFGGSKRGVWGATIGLVIGLFFAPIGLILGPFFGALVGEMTISNDFNKSFKASLGSVVGFILGVGLKLVVSGMVTYHFFVALF